MPSRAILRVREQAEAAARQRGSSLQDCGLRLFDSALTPEPGSERDQGSKDGPIPVDRTDVTHQPISPFSLGETYETQLTRSRRRRTGAHLTPERVARSLVDLMPEPSPRDRILDPAVGGAAFLLAAADRLVASGASPAQVRKQLFGVDIEPAAIAVAEAALCLWGLDHGLDPAPIETLTVGDGLVDPLPRVDHVVGNPPFLTQLRSASSHGAERRRILRDRWGDLVGTYTDDAWLFLCAGLAAVTSGGALAMVQPISLLAARHARTVRAKIDDQARLTAMWVARDQVFSASVQVCGLVLGRVERQREPSSPAVTRRVGADFEPVTPFGRRPGPDDWSRVAAGAFGVPDIDLTSSERTLGEIVTATAGFRDQFYGFVPYVSEAPDGVADGDGGDGQHEAAAPLITVGMIDVLGSSWGRRAFKFAKREFTRPVIDLQALAAGDPKLAAWVDARRRPKVLMATQTRVVEVWVDPAGNTIPATPVLSIEPVDDEPDTLWHVAAVLSSPAISATYLASSFGTALALDAIKVRAADVLVTPLPEDVAAWSRAAELLRDDPTNLPEFARLMNLAYGITGSGLSDWWLGRVRPLRRSTG